MNYIGSKLKLSQFIKDTVYAVVGKDLSDKVFCDLFAGTGIVGRTFKPEVKQVISNDLEYYSYVLNRHYIANSKPLPKANELIDELNNLPLKSGFIYNHYCLGGNSGRQYFSDENGKKIDTVRITIEQWREQKRIDDDYYFFLLASLLENADKVANTASVYGAYLKKLKKSAQKELVLEAANIISSTEIHNVYNSDSNQLINKIEGDILYLDPPYNARQYGANYHMLNTIARYDDFVPKGKTGLRVYEKSNYCSKAKVKAEFDELIKNARFQYVFLSYNNEGLMSVDDVKEVMSRYGKYNLFSTQYQRFKADKTENRNHKATETEEYLHVLNKL